MNCPNCSAPMERHSIDGVYAEVEVDLCFFCHLMWLDQLESVQLSPRGTIDLFRLLHEHGDDPRHAVDGSQICPHCTGPLNLLHDIGKGGRFSYYACADWHGRLTPFSEFLREKQFVRALQPLEKERLKAQLQQVQCSGCGAPVDLSVGFECGHCGAPITVLDRDAVERTLRDLYRKEEERKADAEAKRKQAPALVAMETLRTDPDDLYSTFTSRGRRGTGSIATDLLTMSVRMLFGGR